MLLAEWLKLVARWEEVFSQPQNHRLPFDPLRAVSPSNREAGATAIHRLPAGSYDKPENRYRLASDNFQLSELEAVIAKSAVEVIARLRHNPQR